MYLQWGFDDKGVKLIFCSERTRDVDFSRKDVFTVYVEDKDSKEKADKS